MKPKIFYIIDNLILAGAEIHLFNLVKGLKEKGYVNIEVISLSGEGEICDWIKKTGIPVHNYRIKSFREPVFYIDIIKLLFYMIKNQPSIVHTYLDTANVIGVIIAKLSGIKKIMTSRRDLGVFRSRRMELIIGKLSNSVNKIVCVCEAAAKVSVERERLHGNNIIVIHNGIDIHRFNSEKVKINDRIIYCNVAVANRKEKGHEDLVKAFALVAEKSPDVLLKLVGDGPLLPGLKELAADLGIQDKVIFVGQSNNISSELKDVSVFVLPSHSEGISNALLEAMAMNIPSVVTAVGGNIEVIEDGISGLWANARDPVSLADAMMEIIKDRNKLVIMGESAGNRVRSMFSYDKMIQKYDDLYTSTY